LSQKNLSSAFKVSVELKFLRQLVMELFCSISKLKSKNVSSLAVTVSHLRHRVSFVSIPCMHHSFKKMIFLATVPLSISSVYQLKEQYSASKKFTSYNSIARDRPRAMDRFSFSNFKWSIRTAQNNLHMKI
jgi:hypothetical protein